MDRTVYIEIAGKTYPMRKTIGAVRNLTEKYGDLEKLSERLASMTDLDRIDAYINMLEILIWQGCTYKNLFEKGAPAPENAPVENGEWIPISAVKLQCAMDLDDTEYIMDRLAECFNAGIKKTVASKTEEKNGEAM